MSDNAQDARGDGNGRSDQSPVLVATDIEAGYDHHQVLHGVSIQSHPGVTCIFGPNGSGKSTLLKSLNGVVPVWSGSVTYGDTDITDLNPEEIVTTGIASLPQGGGIFGTMTVEDNLDLGAFTVNDSEVVARRKEEVLDVFPVLEEKLGDKASSLSGGQQMMVSLGRAMMTGADTYLMDEPSAGLAPTLVDDAFELLERLVEQGARIVLIEQNVVAALRIADYIYILAEGELQFEGEPSDLGEEEDLMEVYLGIG